MDHYLLWIFILTLVLVEAKEMNKKCLKLTPPVILGCCKSGAMPSATRSIGSEECMKMPENSCQHDICIGKELGYASNDGNIDKVALEKLVVQIIKKAPSLIAALKKNCINGDLGNFGSPQICNVVKLKNCIQMQAINDCKEWRDKGPCAGIKDLVKECANAT